MSVHTPSSEAILQETLERKYRDAGPARTIWRLTVGQRLNLLWATLFYLIKTLPVWCMPIVIANTINLIATHPANGARLIVFNAVVIFLLIAQNIPTHTLYATKLSKVIRRIQTTLRSAMVIRLQQLSIRYHDEIESGRLQSKVLRDVDALDGLGRSLFNTGLGSIGAISVALGVTLYKRPEVALFYLLAVPIAIVLIRGFSKRIGQRNREFRQEVEAMSASVSEMIQMIPITRAHAAEHTEIARITAQLEKLYTSGQRLDLSNEWFGSSSWVAFNLFQMVCLFFCAAIAWRGGMKVGDVVLFQGFFGSIVGAVNGLAMIYPQLTTGLESVRSVCEVLECPDLEFNEGKKPVKTVQGRLTFQHVGFQYAPTMRAAIDDLNVDIEPGQCVAFVGESGSGKSTLMNLVIGFRRPTAGKILLDGQDMAELNLREFRRHLAVVPQQTLLFSGTVRENITYGLEHFREEDVQRVLDIANVREFVEQMPQKLDTRIGEFGKKLSGGQRQRIAIARAMLRNPRVIILDEATSALDVISEKLVQEAINRLVAGRTTLIVAHRLSTIRHADRIVVMQNGRAVESGGHEELLRKNGAFARLRALQV